jgi:hypothetical protein
MVRLAFATEQELENLGVALERQAEFRQSAEWLSNFHCEEGGNSHKYLYYFAHPNFLKLDRTTTRSAILEVHQHKPS